MPPLHLQLVSWRTRRAPLVFSLAAVLMAATTSAQQKTAEVTLDGQSIQLLPSAPVSIPTFGEVVTRFSTFGQQGGLPLMEATRGDLMSGELRPAAAGGYEGSYGQMADSTFWDYGSYTLSLPTGDADENRVPDAIQFDRPGSFVATGAGFSGPSGLTFTLSVTFSRAAFSAHGTYLATAQTSEGLWNLVAGPFVLLSYRGTAVYTRGVVDTLELTLASAAMNGKGLRGWTTFSSPDPDTIVLSPFTATDTDGNGYQVTATTLRRRGARYQGTLLLEDGLKETRWTDFAAYAVTVTDGNDANGNGVPDLTDGISAGPVVTLSPEIQAVAPGGEAHLAVTASSGSVAAVRWLRNGGPIGDTTASQLTVTDLQPAAVGIYSAVATIGSGQVGSGPALIGLSTTAKITGAGHEVGADIVHPNGNVYDQVLLTGAAVTVTADPGQITRTSFIDLNDDIVQVEFSGAGSLTLMLSGASEPAAPTKYHQPAVTYIKGHAGILIAGADETTNVSVFTVGRATAFDPTSRYDITRSVGGTNDPANNGSPLFQGHEATDYDSVADIAFIAIASRNGRFGGVRTANAHYFAAQGLTGVYAPGVALSGPLYVGDVDAHDAAQPVLVVGAVDDARIAGGDLFQTNGRYVQVSGIVRLTLAAGQDSSGRALEAQHSRAVFRPDGASAAMQLLTSP